MFSFLNIACACRIQQEDKVRIVVDRALHGVSFAEEALPVEIIIVIIIIIIIIIVIIIIIIIMLAQ